MINTAFLVRLLQIGATAGCLLHAANAATEDRLETYPALPGGEYRSERYELTVSQGGVSRPAYVYLSTNTCNPERSFTSLDNSYASFSFRGPVTVEVCLPQRETVSTVEVRPLSRGVQASHRGNVVSFTLDQPGQYYVAIDGEERHPLFIFADPLETGAPAASGDPRVCYLEPGRHGVFPADAEVYYLKPGLHDIGTAGGTLQQVASGKTMYVAGGAFVRGRIAGVPGGTLKIRGRGVVSGIATPYLKKGFGNFLIDGSKSILDLEGVTVVDAHPNGVAVASYTAGSVARNVKVMLWDFGVGAFGNSLNVSDSFIKANDDGITTTSHLHHRNLVVWIQHGSPIQLGWNLRVEVTDVAIDGLEIIGDSYGTPASGTNMIDDVNVVSLANIDGGFYHDVTIANVNVDVPVHQVLGLHIKSFFKGFQQGRGYVDGITFRNFNVRRPPMLKSIFRGNGTETGEIRNVVFENIVITGVPLTEQNSGDYIVRERKTSGFVYKSGPATGGPRHK